MVVLVWLVWYNSAGGKVSVRCFGRSWKGFQSKDEWEEGS